MRGPVLDAWRIGPGWVATTGDAGQAGGMQTQDGNVERRRALRSDSRGMVYLSRADQTAKAQLADHSTGGLRIRTRAAVTPGEILYCAVPSLAVCTRARVVHVSGGWVRRTVGLEYLATLSDWGSS